MPRGKKKSSPILSGGVRPVRKHRETGIITDRRRGRHHPDYEYGFTVDNGKFQPGEPKITAKRKARKARKKTTASLAIDLGGEIRDIVEAEIETRVQARLAKAGQAAMKAFNKAIRA